MKTREKIMTGLLVVVALYAGWMTVSANRLRTELATLRATHQQLQEGRRQMRERLLRFATNAGAGDEAFRKVLAVLEADGQAELIIPSGPTITRVNKVPRIQIK
jgi:hypothetical protein